MNFKADLHTHSNFSDGSYSPKKIVDMAKEIGLSGLSITDHDSITAYPDILSYAEEKNIKMIPGVEFSASHAGVSVHILGYSFALDNTDMDNFCSKHRTRRINRCHAMLEKFKALNIDIDEKEIFESNPDAMWGRPHFAKILIQKGYASSMKEAFKKYLIKGAPCFVPGGAFSAEETVAVIHKANGLAVIAHPHLIYNNKTLKSLLKIELDGIESYYANFDRYRCNNFIDMANKNGLLITGGSDFHGVGKPENKLGSSWVDQNNFLKLYEHYKYVQSNA